MFTIYAETTVGEILDAMENGDALYYSDNGLTMRLDGRIGESRLVVDFKLAEA